MKKTLTALILALTASFAFGHGDIELGPNKGRILEFSKNETMHGEVTEKDGKLHIALLDKDMKPVSPSQCPARANGSSCNTRIAPMSKPSPSASTTTPETAPPAKAPNGAAPVAMMDSRSGVAAYWQP